MSTTPAPRRRWLRAIVLVVVVVLLVALFLRLVLRPSMVTAIALQQAGAALGLEITAGSVDDYRLRGSPMLAARDVRVREPGAATDILLARRVELSVPWSTVRSAGKALDIERVVIDAPLLDLPALQHWLASRPPGDTRLPTLSDGLQVTRGRVELGNDRRLVDVALSAPRWQSGKPVAARTSGRFRDGELSVVFDLALALARPANPVGAAVVGPLRIEGRDWTLQAGLHLSGPLHLQGGDVRVTPARLALDARYRSGATDIPFVLGLHGPLQYARGTLAWAPAGIALRDAAVANTQGKAVVPDLDGRGIFAYGQRLLLRVDGRLQQWPPGWPALPAPLATSRAPMSLQLDYLGAADLSGAAHLGLQSPTAAFDARFALPQVLAWSALPPGGQPLPPMVGTLHAATLELAGATLEGVDITLHDDALPAEGAHQDASHGVGPQRNAAGNRAGTTSTQ